MILLKLQEKFPQIKKAFFEKEGANTFLRIEVNEPVLAKLTILSQEISQFLDNFEKEIEYTNYFLDVYSTGTEKILDKNNLKKYLENNVQVILKNKLNQKTDYIGILLNDDPITIKWNNKGQFKKIVIPFEEISEIKLYASLNKKKENYGN